MFWSVFFSVSCSIPTALLPDSAAPLIAPTAAPAAAPVSTDFAASFARLRMAFEGRFFPDFFVEVRLAEALRLVEACVVEALLRLPVPLRFFLEVVLDFLPAAFLVPFVPFFDLLELVDPLADRLLLDFFAADRLRAFVVGMLFSSIAPSGRLTPEPGPRQRSLMPSRVSRLIMRC
ncbi:MAG: hypothetical protein LC770_08375 [Acidobacteria bacterium]|nr:hypothetical protein [Acidobacteriota bacterium]